MTDTIVTATGRFVRSPGFKFFTLGVLSLLLLIPASLVWLLVSEREDRARDVAREIAQTWGGSQQINGPWLIVPYDVELVSVEDDEETRTTVRHQAVFLPDTLNIDAQATSEVRTRGIFDVPVYGATIDLSGSFSAPQSRSITSQPARFYWSQARLAVGISAVRAIRNAVTVNVTPEGEETQTRNFEPSLGVSGIAQSSVPGVVSLDNGGRQGMAGIHVPSLFENRPQAFSFDMRLELNGSRSLFVAPVARDTQATITSDWPHPSFTGAALPETSDISADGFSASWQVPHLARSVPLAFSLSGNSFINRLTQDSFGVRFFQPVDYYASVDRALKYAILFIGIVFLSVFVIEVRTGKRVHVVQYVFVGLTLVLFYVLLLSLAEHLGFMVAYLLAALATALLIGSYCASSLESKRYGALVFGLLSGVFGVLFLFLRLEDYALLAGSIFAFAVLAITMFATQRIDWSGKAGEMLGAATPTATSPNADTSLTKA